MAAHELQILSSLLQDATVRLEDMTYDHKHKRFICVMNRIAREVPRRRFLFFRARPQRRQTGIHFNLVQSISKKNMNATKADKVFSLLTMKYDHDKQGNHYIYLLFADNAQIRLVVEDVEVAMSDLGAAWEAKTMPKHQF